MLAGCRYRYINGLHFPANTENRPAAAGGIGYKGGKSPCKRIVGTQMLCLRGQLETRRGAAVFTGSRAGEGKHTGADRSKRKLPCSPTFKHDRTQTATDAQLACNLAINLQQLAAYSFTAARSVPLP